jgi:hypothetical protein
MLASHPATMKVIGWGSRCGGCAVTGQAVRHSLRGLEAVGYYDLSQGNVGLPCATCVKGGYPLR